MKEPVKSLHRRRKLFWGWGWIWNFFRRQIRDRVFDWRLRQIRKWPRLRTWGRIGRNGHGGLLSTGPIHSRLGLFLRNSVNHSDHRNASFLGWMNAALASAGGILRCNASTQVLV